MNIDRLRSSFDRVVSRDALVIERFYEILFARYPQAQRLFGRNTKTAQAKMLTSALASVLDKIEDASWLESTLVPMGAKHVGYGVTDVMYDWVGECLIAALAEVAGDDWSDDAADWVAAYGAVAGLMKKGAAEAAAAA